MAAAGSLTVKVPRLRDVHRRITVFVSALAHIKVYSDDAPVVSLTKPLYSRQLLLPSQSSISMAADETDLVCIDVAVGMKVPDALPQPYAMLEVRVGVTGLGRRSCFEDDRKQLMALATHAVMNDMAEMAALLRGKPPFSAEELGKARAAAAAAATAAKVASSG